jgi:hypothetical protein
MFSDVLEKFADRKKTVTFLLLDTALGGGGMV